MKNESHPSVLQLRYAARRVRTGKVAVFYTKWGNQSRRKQPRYVSGDVALLQTGTRYRELAFPSLRRSGRTRRWSSVEMNWMNKWTRAPIPSYLQPVRMTSCVLDGNRSINLRNIFCLWTKPNFNSYHEVQILWIEKISRRRKKFTVSGFQDKLLMDWRYCWMTNSDNIGSMQILTTS